MAGGPYLKVKAYQESLPEKIVHEDWDEGNALRHDLEGAGDILRELTKQNPDPGYMGAKLERLDRYVLKSELDFIQEHQEARKTASSQLRRLIEAYEKQPTETSEQETARQLILAIAKYDYEGAKKYAEEVRSLLKKGVPVVQHPREIDVMTQEQVGDLLAMQPANQGRSASELISKWVPSRQFKKRLIPVDSVGVASEAIGQSVTQGPVVVDENINEVGRFEGMFGAAPEVLVIDGKHRLKEAIERGEKTIEAQVGEKALPYIEKAMAAFSQKQQAITQALVTYWETPNGTTLMSLQILLPEAKVAAIRAARKPIAEKKPFPPDLLKEYPGLVKQEVTEQGGHTMHTEGHVAEVYLKQPLPKRITQKDMLMVEAVLEHIKKSTDQVNVEQFRMGLEVEQEHGPKENPDLDVTGDDPIQTGKIALAHLREDPRYYTRLRKMERQAEEEKQLEQAIASGGGVFVGIQEGVGCGVALFNDASGKTKTSMGIDLSKEVVTSERVREKIEQAIAREREYGRHPDTAAA